MVSPYKLKPKPGLYMQLTLRRYVGPLGKMIGASGGDIANELAFGITTLSYIPIRWLELKYVGR